MNAILAGSLDSVAVFGRGLSVGYAGGMTYCAPVPSGRGGDGLCPVVKANGQGCSAYATRTGYCAGHNKTIGRALGALLTV